MDRALPTEQLTFAVVKRHCESRGWTVRLAKNLALFSSPKDSSDAQLNYVIAASPILEIQREEVQDLLKGIGVVEGIAISEVLDELLKESANPLNLEQYSFRLRIAGKTAQSEPTSLRLDEMEGVVNHLKGVLSYSLSCELSQPEPWRQKPKKQASSLADSYEFAHTQRGSFVVNVRAPGRLYAQTSLLERAPAPEERALARMSFGLDWIQRSEFDSVDGLSETAVTQGLNANMAQQLFSLGEALGPYKLELLFSFPNSAVERTTARPGPFRIDGPICSKLRKYFDLLTQPLDFHGPLTAKVIETSARRGPSDQSALFHSVEFLTSKSPDVNFLFHEKKIRHSLNNEEFQRAYEYQRSGATVKIEGHFQYVRGYVKALNCKIVW